MRTVRRLSSASRTPPGPDTDVEISVIVPLDGSPALRPGDESGLGGRVLTTIDLDDDGREAEEYSALLHDGFGVIAEVAEVGAPVDDAPSLADIVPKTLELGADGMKLHVSVRQTEAEPMDADRETEGLDHIADIVAVVASRDRPVELIVDWRRGIGAGDVTGEFTVLFPNCSGVRDLNDDRANPEARMRVAAASICRTRATEERVITHSTRE